MNLVFFLGGRDLEMQAISDLVREERGPKAVLDKGLKWGAKASDYQDEISAALKQGKKPVLVELDNDLPARFNQRRLIVIDHHGPRAGADQPTSLHQVFTLLDLPEERWSRDLALIAANDTGHIIALRAMGASKTEICDIRDRDRAAQGVSADDESEAKRAIAARETHGALTVVETTSHTSSAIGDRIEPEYGGPGAENLLVLMPEKAAFFGKGDVVKALADDPAFTDSWHGGALPDRGYWGTPIGDLDDNRRTTLPQQISDLLLKMH